MNTPHTITCVKPSHVFPRHAVTPICPTYHSGCDLSLKILDEEDFYMNLHSIVQVSHYQNIHNKYNLKRLQDVKNGLT